MRKTFWFDCETTGLKAGFHDAHQVAYLLDVDGDVVEEGKLLISPTRWENIDADAIAISGTTMEALKSTAYMPATAAHGLLTRTLSRHVQKYDKRDKLYPAGFNCRFDYDFLQDIFVQAGDKFFGSWFNHKTIDPLALLRVLDFEGLLFDAQGIPLANLKLATACAAYGVQLDGAHDSLADVRATRDLYHKLVEVDWPRPDRPRLTLCHPPGDGAC